MLWWIIGTVVCAVFLSYYLRYPFMILRGKELVFLIVLTVIASLLWPLTCALLIIFWKEYINGD